MDRLLSGGLAVLFQLVLFTCILLFFWGNSAVGEGPGGEAGFAEIPGEALTNTDDGNLDDTPAGTAGDAASELTNSPDVAITPPTTTGDGIDLSIELAPSGGSTGGGGGAADGFGFSSKGGGGEANFLGTASRGNRFCIIADNSGSMAGAPLEYVKAEILKTVGNARGSAKFHVVFFSDQARDQPSAKWVSGKTETADLAAWVSRIGPEGGTSPIVGFNVALKLDPAPDVIYLMTDGGFDPNEVQAIAAQNAKLKKPAVIHTIAFLNRSGEQQLKKIALDGNGTYRFVAGFNRP